ncbi:hypothetical protein CHU98_g1843 [Xylaria longipes]|nr:hypothetical protein CHU98_g1843 [Xylaria longipes]
MLIALLLLLPLAPSPSALDEIPTLHPRQQMSTGSSCADSEGQWDCMTSSFQRCTASQWSEVQQCALSTRCSPAGLTHEFHVDYADGYLGTAPPGTSGGRREMLVNRWLLLLS